MGDMIVQLFPGFVTVTEAAAALGKSHAQVTRYVKQGLLQGEKVGNQVFIRKSSLKDFEPPLRGNPAFRHQSEK